MRNTPHKIRWCKVHCTTYRIRSGCSIEGLGGAVQLRFEIRKRSQRFLNLCIVRPARKGVLPSRYSLTCERTKTGKTFGPLRQN